jgi:hypothetical protein
MTIQTDVHNVTSVTTNLNIYDTFNVTRVEIRTNKDELVVLNLYSQGHDPAIQLDEEIKDYRGTPNGS